MERRRPHYSDLLMDLLLERRSKNSSYSLRAYARDLHISAATLSQVLARKRDLSPASARRVAERLSLSPRETQDLLATVRGDSDGVDWSEAQLLQEDTFKAMSEWYYFAILSLARIPGNQASPAWIAGRLGLGVPEARGALRRLERLGFIEIRSGRMVRTQTSFTTTDGIPSSALRSFHAQNLERARSSLERDPIAVRDVSSLTLALDPAEMAVARREIQRFKKRFPRQLRSRTPKEVYTLAIQFFPQTKGEVP